MIDLGQITHVCICGSRLWLVKCIFHEYEIAAYMLDMECAMCHARAITPTLADKPEE